MKALATPKKWTPKIAGKFCKSRINRIKRDLAEISACYGDVDLSIEDTAERLIGEIDDLYKLIDEAVKEGRGI